MLYQENQIKYWLNLRSYDVLKQHLSAKATAQLITPPCQSQSVAQFLWEHLQRDLDVLGRALGRSVDDAALTVHLVLQQMISLNGGQTGTNLFSSVNILSQGYEHISTILSKMWSATFSRMSLLTPVLNGLSFTKLVQLQLLTLTMSNLHRIYLECHEQRYTKFTTHG